MTYDPLKPQPSDFLSQSVSDIQGNFAQANVVMNIDHYPFDNVTANVGYHKQVHMPELLAAPGTAVNIGALYTKVGTNPAETNLFFQAENSGFEYQITKVSSSNTATFSSNGAYGAPPAGFTQIGGWTFLPGNLILMYGFYGKAGALGSSGSIQFPFAFPNAVFSITCSLNRTSSGNQTITVNTVGLPNFTFLSSSSSSDGIYWQAIGN